MTPYIVTNKTDRLKISLSSIIICQNYKDSPLICEVLDNQTKMENRSVSENAAQEKVKGIYYKTLDLSVTPVISMKLL